MQEGKPRGTLEKGHHSGMFVKTFLIRPPGLKRAPGNLTCLSGLTHREPLRFQIERVIEELSALGAIPAGGTMSVALLCLLDYRSHSDLLV